MFDNLRAAVLVPEIRQRILFVFFAFAWFVFMIHVQLPNVNQEAWQRVLQSGAFYNLLGFLSGGALQKLSIIAMGITPYINASIIMQLMTVVLPQLEEMAKKGGEEGRKKISQYTRWLTIVLGTIQATFMGISMERSGVFYDTSTWYLLYAIIAMVGGTLFLMWLGEQISDKGIGNGVSLIIFIGIVLRYPQYVKQTYTSASQGAESLLNLILYIVIAIVVIVSIVFLYQGQRRVPVQQARRVVGRKMFAGRSTYIPLRLNNAGVISIIFAISILLLPQQALSWFSHGGAAPTFAHLFGPFQIPTNPAAVANVVNVYFSPNGVLYNIVYFILVVVFTFFYSSVVLNTRDVADNLKKTGAFVPGIRPGQPTVDYLNKILMRITTAAAIYLGLLAVLPGALQRGLSVTTFYLGSTSLLIVVGVALDTITQIEARLAMRDYRGFIKR
ncbi:MAG: preprotein translocase subunit SecY [Candidatus Eremiobacteraeota bacterium]|nr:preprotein translocase subunit SecY [Candidatus Eremiobacteraeota bacterium]MBV9263042.1 preprotein translocase subunit SecY [Candidatus Eremiobacteraeota bacterium]